MSVACTLAMVMRTWKVYCKKALKPLKKALKSLFKRPKFSACGEGPSRSCGELEPYLLKNTSKAGTFWEPDPCVTFRVQQSICNTSINERS